MVRPLLYPSSMFIERPLASLSPADATRLVRALFAPDAADALLENLADPDVHTIGFQKVSVSWQEAGGASAFQPVGMFGYCALSAHPLGDRIARGLPKRFAGPFGLAHSIGIVPGSPIDLDTTIFLSLAHAAAAAGHQQLVVVTDRVRAERLGRFGIELFPGLLHNCSTIVGVFDAASAAFEFAVAA